MVEKVELLAEEPKEVRFPALTRLVAETLKGSQAIDDFLKESTRAQNCA